MTDLQIWGIIASLIMLAIGLALKSAQDVLVIKHLDKDVSRLMSEIETLKKNHSEIIAGIQQSNAAEKEKLSKRVSDLERQIEIHHQSLQVESWKPLDPIAGY